MLKVTSARALVVFSLLAAISVPTVAWAQELIPATSANAKLSDQWNDFIHYIKIARADLALSYGKAILESKADPREVYRLSTQTNDLVLTLARGEKLEGLADTVKAIRQMIEQGYLLESRDPQEIAKAIDMLAGSLRQYQIGSERLKMSGEYAIPQIIQRLSKPDTASLLRDRIVSLLPNLGKESVRPMCAALSTPDASTREVVARTLGALGYWQAAPYLKARLADPSELQNVKASAEASLIAVAGRQAVEQSVPSLFYELALRYYNHNDSLNPDPRYQTANVWYWKEGLGLTYMEVPTVIFNDVYAMRSCRTALETDSSFSPAVSLWLASNLRKSAELPEGVTDPTRLPDEMSAAAFAKAAGAGYMQEVLARALKDNDANVAMGAIAALAQVAGAENLLKPTSGGATPLVPAITFPNRRVRFMAADALANARPNQKFNGDELVVTVLTEALRQTGQRTALVVSPDEGTRNNLKDLVRANGYDAVDADNLGAGMEAARRSSGVDVVILSANVQSPDAHGALAMLRSNPMFSSLPVVFVAQPADAGLIAPLAQQDSMVISVDAPGLDQNGMAAALKKAGEKLVGPKAMSDEEAAQWALKAANSLRMLALTHTPVFDLTRAEPALIDALKDKRDDLKVAAARALAQLPSGNAQQAIVNLAGSDAPQAVRVAVYGAASESVRQFGNQLNEALANSVIAVVLDVSAPQEIRDAASELLGALNLPSQQIKVLITNAGVIK